ncbi:transposase [Streptomyces sp. CA-243310]|uniref:transposase n=1 Tax=Streptomyces sp. CA-243310 TaxID=3240056 RepID=UPI003D8E817A
MIVRLGANPYLKRWGLAFQRPDKRAVEQDAEAVRVWHEETWVMCRFLTRIVGHFDRKVHLIFDRHSAHRSKTVQAWLAGRTDEIEVHFLPSYSPELNPDEPVNADLKRSLPHTHRARNQVELAAETLRFFHRRRRQPHIVRCYFGGPHVRYVLDENPLSF